MAMKRMGGWFSTSSKSSLGPSRSLTALDEPHALEEMLRAASLIMNDEVDLAETELSKGNSPFHKLGSSTLLFLRATLGFEKEIMEQAGVRLADTEESASEHHRRAIRSPSAAHQSKIYPIGAEFALVNAESQLMSAVIAVLSESLTESLRGFYKLRKAFGTLQEIVEAENRYLEKYKSSSKSSLATSSTRTNDEPPPDRAGDKDDDLDFKDAEEGLSEQPTPIDYQGHLDLPDVSKIQIQKSEDVKAHSNGESAQDFGNGESAESAAQAEDELDFKKLTSDPIDLYIHSGTALCYGLLQLMISMIPPAFSKLLSILSFRGDRETGLRLLWRATSFKANINGAMAALLVLGYHNAAVALCDIHSREALPEARLHALLTDMRSLYPKSAMWVLQESGMSCAQRKLERSLDILTNNPTQSPLKQVEALRVFETSLVCMFLHRYQECADSFLKCIKLNNWSHGLYYYIAGCCHVELYRSCQDSDPEKATEHKESATAILGKVTAHTGKKRLMARQLPLDVFINRKIAKWTHRAKTRNCDLIDAVGVSPIEEMIYFWSGFKRMSEDQLQASLQRLSSSSPSPISSSEPADELAIAALLRATCLRGLGRISEAQDLLREGVLCYEWHQIKACDHADNWPTPVAYYELSVCAWHQAGGQDGDRDLLEKASENLRVVEKWESFDLDARIGLKLTTARETLSRITIA
ncbi:Hypothetical predicted protein [Lecanosticta acicola]|uniref:Inclusion body clearance protein IML2 n=1 Tax=Lecanosticta acicola TaxID=111012 RepID=A0AAI8Z8R8_9PEZI|nr:Hypothetical predicted protein [Lecanosticta acicola]